MTKKPKIETNGCRPFLQGYWAKIEGRPLGDWPQWLHPDKEFQREWTRGWKSAEKGNNQ